MVERKVVERALMLLFSCESLSGRAELWGMGILSRTQFICLGKEREPAFGR